MVFLLPTLDNLASGVVDQVIVSLDYSTLSTTIHLYGVRLIFAKTLQEAPPPTESGPDASSVVEQEPDQQDEANTTFLDKTFDVTFKVSDTTVIYKDIVLVLPSLELGLSPTVISTSESAILYYDNILVAQVRGIRLDTSADSISVSIQSCLLVLSEIPPALLIRREYSASVGGGQPFDGLPIKLTITIDRLDGFLSFEPLQVSETMDFFNLYTQINKTNNLETSDGLPRVFSNKEFLEYRKTCCNSDNLLSDILAHAINKPHLKLYFRDTFMCLSRGFEISVGNALFDEWISPDAGPEGFSPYIPIVRFTNDDSSQISAYYSSSSSNGKFSYDYEKKTDKVLSIQLENNGDIQISSADSAVHVVLDFDLIRKRIPKLLIPKKRDLEASMFYTASESIARDRPSRTRTISIQFPHVRAFLTCPDYDSIIATK